MSARAAIHARLRGAPVTRAVAPDLLAYFAEQDAPDPATRMERFMQHARSWRAEVIETGEQDWAQAVAAVAHAKNLRALMAGRGTALAAPLAAALGDALSWYDDALAACKDCLFTRVDAGITTARGGIAETGSLILWPNISEPRTLSLVPPVHIAVLRASTLHETLHGAMTAQRWANAMPSNALLVSGPSKTADIQRILAYGAHGPKELIVVLVRDA